MKYHHQSIHKNLCSAKLAKLKQIIYTLHVLWGTYCYFEVVFRHMSAEGPSGNLAAERLKAPVAYFSRTEFAAIGFGVTNDTFSRGDSNPNCAAIITGVNDRFIKVHMLASSSSTLGSLVTMKQIIEKKQISTDDTYRNFVASTTKNLEVFQRTLRNRSFYSLQYAQTYV